MEADPKTNGGGISGEKIVFDFSRLPATHPLEVVETIQRHPDGRPAWLVGLQFPWLGYNHGEELIILAAKGRPDGVVDSNGVFLIVARRPSAGQQAQHTKLHYVPNPPMEPFVHIRSLSVMREIKRRTNLPGTDGRSLANSTYGLIWDLAVKSFTAAEESSVLYVELAEPYQGCAVDALVMIQRYRKLRRVELVILPSVESIIQRTRLSSSGVE